MVTARGTTAAVVGLLLAGVATGCDDGSPGGSAPEPSPSAASWSASADPLDTGGLVWASGPTVHLGDGTTVELGAVPDSYVVAGDGVYFTTDDVVGGDAAAIGARPLYAADRDGGSREVAAGVATPRASPDGRYLVFLDVLSSPTQDRFGTTQVETCLLYTSPSPRDGLLSRMPSSA